MSSPHPPFIPSPADEDRILALLAEPEASLAEVAVHAKTTLRALVRWMKSPAVAQEIADLRGAIAERARLLAVNHLPFAVLTTVQILREYYDEESRAPLPGAAQGVGGSVAPNPPPLYSGSNAPEHHETPFRSAAYCLTAFEQRRRSRETARRAASLLLRLARVHAVPPDVAPKGDSRCGSLDSTDSGCQPSRTSGATKASRLPAATLKELLALLKTYQPAPTPGANAEGNTPSATPPKENPATPAHVADHAPALSFRAGVAGGGEPPASAHPNCAPGLEPRAPQRETHQPVEISVPHLDPALSPSPVIHANGNGHAQLPRNEHWP